MKNFRNFKNLFLRSSIQRKIMVMVMTISFVTLLIACAGFIAYDIHAIKNSKVQELQLVGDVIGKRIAPLMSFMKDNDKANRIISDLSSKDSVVLSCAYMEKEGILATYRPQGIKLECPYPAPQIGYDFSSEYVSVHREIRSLDDTLVGSIYILSDLREFDKHLREFSIGMAILITISMFIAYVMTKNIKRVITRPIMSLASAARSVKNKNDYTARARHYNDDELGFLADSFNNMMDEVENGRNTLEYKVKKRTQKIEDQKKELEKTNKDLAEQKVKAEAANVAKSEFLRNMSHEFRTPLHGMGSFANYGIAEYKTADREELRHFFKRILTSNKRLLKLVENILLIARIENGTESFNFVRADLQSTLKNSVKEIELLLEDKKLKLEILPADFPTQAVYDHGKISQVFTNILGNAVEYTRAEKSIFVAFSETSLEKDGNKCPALSISFADQGVGIPEEDKKNIFDKFVQSSRTNTGAGGTGLGLTISSQMIAAHEGTITVDNNEYGGATFTVTIPSYLEEGKRTVKIFDYLDTGENNES